mmetsp:Transcript_94932/g.277573  ORF Transcript_94932/g.277573 Transcript_94932/m.277573 type:complete len:214 (-) Transcript_94932:165-806(-)
MAGGGRRCRWLLAACGCLWPQPGCGDSLVLLQTSASSKPQRVSTSGPLEEAKAPVSPAAAAFEAALAELGALGPNASSEEAALLLAEAPVGPVACSSHLQAAPGNTVRVEFDQIPEPIICSKVAHKEFAAEWGDPVATDLRLNHAATLHGGDVASVLMKVDIRGPAFVRSFKHSYSCPVCAVPPATSASRACPRSCAGRCRRTCGPRRPRPAR